MKTIPPITILDTLVRLDSDRGIPLHVQLRRAIQRVIEDYFDDGQQFWTEQAITASLNVSQITVRRALGDLAKEGLLLRRKSKGSVVCKLTGGAEANYRVALFLPQYDSDLLRNLLRQFVDACHDQGRRLEPIFVRQGMRAADVMGILECGPDEQRLVFLGLPTELGVDLSQLAMDRTYRFALVDISTPHHITDIVGIDDAEGVRLILQHLAHLGHKRVTLVVNEPEAAQPVIIRCRTFEQVTRQLGMTGRVVSCGTRFWESAYDAAYEAMPRVWDLDPAERPTAIVAVSDVGAWAALKWLAENEVRVPRDVSIVGYNDERPSRFTSPALTTIAINAQGMVKATLELLEKPKTERAEVWVHPHLVVRDSTGPVLPADAKPSRIRKRRETILVGV